MAIDVNLGGNALTFTVGEARLIQGPQGEQGKSVESAVINGSGHLILTIYDPVAETSETYDAGAAIGPKGDKGDTGDTGATGDTGPQGSTITAAQIDGNGHLKITVYDPINEAYLTIDTGEARGPQGEQGEKGETGADGDDGITPTIGNNGNWYLGTTDTGKPSRGTTGQNGADGANGNDGTTFTPSVSAAGVISWTNDGGKTNPESVDIVSAVISALPTWTGGSY